ncbi:hypothetical protein P7C73_g1361, partial [Tremellales sp. Uapishka_1]
MLYTSVPPGLLGRCDHTMSSTPTKHLRRPSAASTSLSPELPRRASAINTEQRKARRDHLRDFYGLASKKDAAGPESLSGPNDISARLDVPPGSVLRGHDLELYPRRADEEDDRARERYPQSELVKAFLGVQPPPPGRMIHLTINMGRQLMDTPSQLFEASTTIAHLNSRTPQLLQIVTSLQEAFSDISQLVDSVSEDQPLPPQESEVEQVRQGMERLRLMQVAQSPRKEVVARYETFRAILEKLVEEGIDGMKALLEECEGILKETEGRE